MTTTTTCLVVLGNLLFVATCGAVGINLLRLAWRHRGTPELILGSGLLLMVVGIPLLALSGLGRVTVGELRQAPMIAGFLCLSVSVVLQGAFVWRTFRPNDWWAVALPLALGAAEICVTGAIVTTVQHSPPALPAAEATRHLLFWLRIPVMVCYAWTAIEGYLQFRMAQRRASIGLGNPVVTNRFALWGLAGALGCANTIISSTLHLYGITPFTHPAGAACLGIGSTLASFALLLAFLPPARYLAWIRGRSPAVAS